MKLDYKGRACPAYENRLFPRLSSYVSNHHGNWHHCSLCSLWPCLLLFLRKLRPSGMSSQFPGIHTLRSCPSQTSCLPHCSLRGWGVSLFKAKHPTCVFDLLILLPPPRGYPIHHPSLSWVFTSFSPLAVSSSVKIFSGPLHPPKQNSPRPFLASAHISLFSFSSNLLKTVGHIVCFLIAHHLFKLQSTANWLTEGALNCS